MFDNVLQGTEAEASYKTNVEVDNDTQKMEAGYVSLFEKEGQTALDTFWQVRDEQQENGFSSTSEGVKGRLHQEETDAIGLGLNSFLLDPNVSPEEKAGISALQVTDARPETSLPTKLGRDLLLKDDMDEGIESTEEYEFVRGLAIESIESITKYREAQAAIMEGLDLTGSQTVATAAVDLTQMMIPFVEQANVAEALAKVGEGKESLGAFFALGGAKEDFFNAFKRMPLNQRLESAQKFIDVAHSANKTGFITNQLLEQQMVEELIYGGAYTDVDKWVDNFVSWFDLSLLGKPAAWALRGAQKAAKAGKASAGATKLGTDLTVILDPRQTVRTTTSPIAPLRIASETNVEKSKAMFEAVVEDDTEEAAGALGGTSRVEVIADSIAPEIKVGDSVRSKVNNIDANLEKTSLLDGSIKTALDESNVNALVRKELESASAHVVNRMQEATGVTSRTEMFQHSVTPTGAKISAVYGPAKGGWLDVEDAVELTEIATRDFGITRNDMYILERSTETGEYVRVEEATGNDFLIGIDYDYRVNFSDVLSWDKFSVKRNLFDRVPILAKVSFNRNLFDPASVLDPAMTLGANARVDKSAKITKDFLDIGNNFAKGFHSAGAESKAQMHKYILDANENKIPFNLSTLRGEYGFNDKEILTLRSFREYWDNVWEARNVLDVRVLKNDGYGIYESVKDQERLVSRPIVKGQVSREERIYDPVKGVSTKLDDVALGKIYEDGGTIAKLRKPQQLGGIVTDHMVIRNDNSWRSLRESDHIYPYQEGYFQRMYTSPHFIVREEVTGGGKLYERAVATAETTADANVYLKRLLAEDSTVKYRIRGNLKDPRQQANFEMDTFETSGQSSMRSRGELLQDATAAVRNPDNTNVLGPIDAMISSARSMGKRIGMDDFIQANKQRFMDKYTDVLPIKKGQVSYPLSMSDIGRGDESGKIVADARSTYEYITSLEYGYINAMDNAFKGVLKGLAAFAGEKGLAKTEHALEFGSTIAPTSLAKNLSFQMYIATNPLRQAALNAHQATLLTAAFPKYVLSQKLAADMLAFTYLRMGIDVPKLAAKATGRTVDELKFMFNEYEKSGLSASIDQNNLLRGALTDIAESNKIKGKIGVLSTPVNISRRVGFDLGEEINLASSWLAHYNDATETKPFLDAADFGTISGKARNFTFNMNRAGDMAYNANSLALFFQYVQVPHKALLQATNRAMSPAMRTRLLTYEAVMFTLPPAAMYSFFGAWLPDQQESPEAHEAIVSGMQFYMFNKMLELASGTDVSIDFGNLAPTDAYGLYEFIRGIMTTEVGAMIASTPSGQLFLGNNPRVTNLIKSAVRFVNPIDKKGVKPITMSHMYHDFAKLSSGYSNVMKAKMAIEYGKYYGSRGQVLDASVSTPEAIALAFGFRTMDSARSTWVGMGIYEKSTQYKDDINAWYRETTRNLSTEGTTADESKYITETLSLAFDAFGTNPRAMKIIENNLNRDSRMGKGALYDNILKQADYVGVEEMQTWADAAPDDGRDTKANLNKTIQFMREYEENK